jgi:hypothetical protein
MELADSNVGAKRLVADHHHVADSSLEMSSAVGVPLAAWAMALRELAPWRRGLSAPR